ncbi:tachylectin-related carbohydrate-binding protein [Umezawaea endophytica]|uniref:Tachylectin-related carbohydrate-binding protein n=1 Tax=Umezawaea endophytica TaxID=1654476 RepID=A0A9X2VGY7_9PSEU|nr:tachylectin-related carbohydrate-binding protein [Umezawaea endophytica]MCS7475927.1 tachylectin-related carbohydrate-binding protein [Umezawaea endophytica]
MRTTPRQSLRRLVQIALAAILGVVGIPLLTSTSNVANAVQTAQCSATANVFLGMAGSPDFRLRKHREPVSGQPTWEGDDGIGWGWDVRFMAGANGYVYFIENGELRRHRWLGTGWENAGVSELIGSGWSGWELPAYHFRVTVDSNNNIYSVAQDGNLTLHRFNETTKVLTSTVVDTGWNKYDQVLAGGDGVLYARDPNVAGGTLYRFQHDYRTNTFSQKDKNVGNGWNGYKQISSPGADVLYGTFAGGETWWYRYLPETDTWANSGYGNWKERITTWTGVDEIAPAIDTCKLGALASEVECKPSANVFGAMADTSFRIKPHPEPETGITNWDPEVTVGAGWNGTRFMSAPGGYKYIVRPDGSMVRHRWLGTGWANGGTSELITATGWGGWTENAYRHRLTIDAKGDFYGVAADGNLRRWVFKEADKSFTEEVIEGGWGRFDQVFAAGDGVLYARDPSIAGGALYRFHYDAKNRRWIDYARAASTGWNMFKQIVSPGADVIYGLSGWDVYWYRWDATTKDFALSSEGSGREYIAWWQNVDEIVADIDACKLKAPETITPPSVPAPLDERTQMIYNPQKQRFEVSWVEDSGVLRRGWQSTSGTEVVEFQALSSTGNAGSAALAQQQDGKLVAMARGTDAQVKAHVQQQAGSDRWVAPVGVNGALNTSPVLARSGDLLTAFAVDGNGKLWYAEQLGANLGFKAWRQAADPVSYTMTSGFAVVPHGNYFEIAYLNPVGTVAVKKFSNGALSPQRVASGITGVGTPSAVAFADGKVQFVVRASDGKLYTQKEGASGFAGWTDISGDVGTFAGSPSTIVNAHGIVETVIRSAGGGVYRGGQTAPGSTTWRQNWDYSTHSSSVDPVLAAGVGNEQRVFIRFSDGNYAMWFVPPYTSTDQASARSARETASAPAVKRKIG